jgi:hypothetical protein
MDGNLGVLVPVGVLGVLGTSIIVLTKTITDYILKKKMIDKGFVNEDVQALFKNHTEDNKYTSLKWGLIILFAGLSLMLMEYIPVSPESPFPYGLFAVSVSLGFLIYYFLMRREQNK